MWTWGYLWHVLQHSLPTRQRWVGANPCDKLEERYNSKQPFHPVRKLGTLIKTPLTRTLSCKAQTFSDKALRLSRNRGQKSLNNGRSIFLRLSFVLASTLTYNWVTGMRFLNGVRRQHIQFRYLSVHCVRVPHIFATHRLSSLPQLMSLDELWMEDEEYARRLRSTYFCFAKF